MAVVRLRLSGEPREYREEGYAIGGVGMTRALCMNGAGTTCGSTALGYGAGRCELTQSWGGRRSIATPVARAGY